MTKPPPVMAAESLAEYPVIWIDRISYSCSSLLGRKAMTHLDSVLRSRDITLPTKGHIVKAMVFPVVMYGCESWTIKKAESESRSVVSNSLQPHGPQHSRLPHLSPTPRACSNSCPLNHWCHPTILPSVVPSSSCLQSFPASGSVRMSQLFASGGQSIGASASASVLPVNIQCWLPLGFTGFISLQSKGLSRVFSNTTVQKHQFFGTQLSLWFNSHIHTWLLEKP